MNNQEEETVHGRAPEGKKRKTIFEDDYTVLDS